MASCSTPHDTGWTCTDTLSLAEVNGYPAIATSTFVGSQQVHYILSSSATGQPGTWLSWYSDSARTGTPSLAWIGNAPVLASDGSAEFYLAVGSSPDGAGSWHGGPGGSNGVGDWCSLAGPCLDAFAAVASQNQFDQSLWFSMLADDGVSISAGHSPIDAEAGVDLGANCDLLVVDGVPLVAYEDRTNDAVKVAVMR